MIIGIPDLALVCVGSLKDRRCAELVDMYTKRLSHEARLSVTEIADRGVAAEGKRILELLRRTGGHSFALCEEGSLCTSRDFAASIAGKNGKLVFVIGGPDGLCDEVKRTADERLSLSRLTFTHEIARVLLLEQLYRACTILHNRGYHK